jgi:Golgi phosphoprotein 3 (GPP34)
VTPRIHDRLVDGGLVTVEAGGRSWLVVVRKPDRMRPTPAGEEPRRRLREVLLVEREPDLRTAVLAGLASACGLVQLHVPRDARRAANERAATLAEREAVPEAVKAAIEAAQRATASATLSAQSPIH